MSMVVIALFLAPGAIVWLINWRYGKYLERFEREHDAFAIEAQREVDEIAT